MYRRYINKTNNKDIYSKNSITAVSINRPIKVNPLVSVAITQPPIILPSNLPSKCPIVVQSNGISLNIDKTIAILIECDNARSLGGSCERDVYNIYQQLTTNKVSQSNIYVLTNNIPYFTKKNMDPKKNMSSNSVIELENILKKISLIKDPYSVFIHISGHGYQGTDINKMEIDNRCEQIVLSSGTFTDYQFNSLLVKYIPKSVCVRVSVDTCHSGSFSNFNYQIDLKKNKVPARKVLKPFFTNAYSISACSDSQLDSCDIGNYGGFGGSLTAHMLDNNNLIEFLIGDPIKVRDNLASILKLLNQEPILLIDQ